MSKYTPIDPYKHTGHGLYLSAPFEVEEQVSWEQGFPTENRTFVMSIGCTGADRKKLYLYEIRGIGSSSHSDALKRDRIYFLRGGFYPLNKGDTKDDIFYFEGTDAAYMLPSRDMKEKTEDIVGISGTGIVLSLENIVEDCMQYLKGDDGADPVTIVVTLQHCDYHPVTKKPFSCKVEYRIRPYRHLSGAPKLLKNGREVTAHGYIKDFNEKTNCYVVIVNKISLTSGHVVPGSAGFGKAVSDSLDLLETGSSKTNKYTIAGSSDDEASKSVEIVNEGSSNTSAGGRIRPPKYTPIDHRVQSGSSSLHNTYVANHGIHTPFVPPTNNSNPGLTSTMPFPPSSFDPSSYLPASSAMSAPPAQKRTRAGTARRGAKGRKTNSSQLTDI